MARKTYRGKAADVAFDLDVCIHAGECVRALPKVFDTERRPWILPDEASEAELKGVVALCPSGALEIVAREPEPAEGAVDIRAMDGGPFVIAGKVRVLTADGTVLRETSKVALCRCGHSATKPFCDGSHASAS